jgi:hypothetical protein
MSLILRREHECAHYLTERVFKSMQNNLFDELMADYAGMMAAAGRFRASWFLHFMGLENFPHYRAGGRLENYRGSPPLSDEALPILNSLLKNAAENLETFSNQTQPETPLMVLALAALTLEELASDQAHTRLSAALENARGLIGQPPEKKFNG